jgi:dGTPase
MREAVNDSQAYNYCALPLASYATRPDQSKGRLIEEPDSRHRTPFQRDRDRIIHSAAFRRLKYKTQVFVYHEGDHYRTRLTHTLEVAQVARTLARALQVNEDLAEAVALSHDLGHTPFAHTGGDALDECMKPYGGFDHNDQSLRVLTQLERKYPKWRGLNLSWETLEGVAKHNGPVTGELPHTLARFNKDYDLRLKSYASLEAQIAGLSDDIAYNSHDVEDGLTAGLFTLDALMADVALYAEAVPMVLNRYGDLEPELLKQEAIRHVMGEMIEDVLVQTRACVRETKVFSADDVRDAGVACVAFSPAMLDKVNQLRSFLFANMYRHYTVNRMSAKAKQIVTNLFTAFIAQPSLLPKEVSNGADASDSMACARITADYIAAMTDRQAIKEHQNLFDLSWDIR